VATPPNLGLAEHDLLQRRLEEKGRLAELDNAEEQLDEAAEGG